MKRFVLAVACCLLLPALARAQAPNVANTAQLGSVLAFPYIIWQGAPETTILRLFNASTTDVDVGCKYFNRTTGPSAAVTTIPLPSRRPVSFDISASVLGPSGFGEGMAVCWATDGVSQINWNHLSGTATIIDAAGTSWEYSAWAFAARSGTEGLPVGTAGIINLNGTEFDMCPQYIIGHFSPDTSTSMSTPGNTTFNGGKFAVMPCGTATSPLDLRAPGLPALPSGAMTTVTLSVMNEQAVLWGGINVTCIGMWHSATLPVKANFGNTNAVAFRVESLGGAAACRSRPAVGVVGVHTSSATVGAVGEKLGSTMNSAGSRIGRILWQ
jgi:hypothetical protein